MSISYYVSSISSAARFSSSLALRSRLYAACRLFFFNFCIKSLLLFYFFILFFCPCGHSEEVPCEAWSADACPRPLQGTQFTCFNSTKVQMLTLEALREKHADYAVVFVVALEAE
jgi:hypothetical protein